MITEDYVSLEIAKLLKEKGFDTPGKVWYAEYTSLFSGTKYNSLQFDDYNRFNGDYKFLFYVPTIQTAMKWLREKYRILVVVDYEYECDTTPYYFKIYRLGENGKPERVAVKGVSYDKDDIPTEHIVGYRDWERSNDDFKSYEQASEDAIMYCLENLI